MKILNDLKKKLASHTKRCPECGVKLSRDAKICPECEHVFIKQPKSRIKVHSFNSCCATSLIILILVFWIVWKTQTLQKLLLALILVITILLIVALLVIGGFIFKLKNFFST